MPPFKFAQVVSVKENAQDRKRAGILKSLPQSWTRLIDQYLPFEKKRKVVFSADYEIEGYLITMALNKEEINGSQNGVLNHKLQKCNKLATKSKLQLIGTGEGLAVATRDGLDFAKAMNGVAVTTGRSYRLAALLQAVEKELGDRGKTIGEVECLVWGASTSTGSAVVHALAREGYRFFTLVSSSVKKLDSLCSNIFRNYGISVKKTTHLSKSIKKADIFFIATYEDFKSVDVNFNINDISMEQDILVVRCNPLQQNKQNILGRQPGITPIDAPLIKAPSHLKASYPYDYPAGIIRAEDAETIILALEKMKTNYSLGERIRVEKIEEMSKMAFKHGFKLAGYVSGKEIKLWR